MTIDPDQFGETRDDVRLTLEAENIESRPTWKPLHLQPVFSGCQSARRGGIRADLPARALPAQRLESER